MVFLFLSTFFNVAMTYFFLIRSRWKVNTFTSGNWKNTKGLNETSESYVFLPQASLTCCGGNRKGSQEVCPL